MNEIWRSFLNTRHTGKAWVVGDSVDTNQLAGGGIPAPTPEEELRINCLRGLRPDFADNVSAGDILVAGENFGCGSSRHTAVMALELCGVSMVLAESVARIHWRNSVARAFPVLIVPGASRLIKDQEEIVVDYAVGQVQKVGDGEPMLIKRLSESVEDIYRAGGLRRIIVDRLTRSGFPPQTAAGLNHPIDIPGAAIKEGP